MNGYIYKITNDINDKVYIGKTNLTVEERFKEHCSDYKKRIAENRPLYRAMNRYGKEHFTIDIIEECDISILSDREIYWINYYDSYHNGYNATLGGDGKTLYDYDYIVSLINEGATYQEIENKIGCSYDTILNIAKKAGVSVKRTISSTEQQMLDSKKTVFQYDKQMNYIQSFKSYADAAHWLVDNGYAKTYKGGIRSHIGEVVKGTRKTAYSFI